ncbi:4'-phosphopantetheinyl transferase family protein [Micromonospora sp. BQ11]|uniref:4'-phosphopantetheinyl transferase family protein n=1 Tax=Micromonospora sp. BQ11 TaxID=3452212 RepID=UPI003F887016
MSQLPVPGRDTVYVCVGRYAGGRPAPSGPLLRRLGVALLGAPAERLVLGHRPGGSPVVRVGGPSDGDPTGSVVLPVSVSRTDGFVVAAARARGPVGVDVERLRPLPAPALAERWYAADEAAWVAGRPEDTRAADFLRLWTAKEAVGKALGVGLRDGGLRRRVPVPGGAGPLLRLVPARPDVRVGHPRVDGELVLAVAVVGAEDGVDVVVEVVQGTGHRVTAVRSASTERTSLPVVVRGS